MGIETGADHGGAECNFTSAIIVIEELAKIDPSVSVMCDVHNTLVNTIFRKYGTQAQKDKFLPLLSESKVRPSYGTVHEQVLIVPIGRLVLPFRARIWIRRICSANAGKEGWGQLGHQRQQDVDNKLLRSRDIPYLCKRTWNSTTCAVSSHSRFVKVDPSKGYKGITCFVATKDQGIQIAKKEQKLGIRASSTCTLNFDDLRIPEENVIGEVGKGYKVGGYLTRCQALSEKARRLLLKFSTKASGSTHRSGHRRLIDAAGRVGIAAQMLGLAQGAFNLAVPHTYQRTQFGQPVGTFQGMQHQIAQAAIDIETARLLTYNAARRKDEGKPFTKEAAMAKYWSSVIAQRVSGSAIEWAGGVGFTRETGIEKFWRDSKIVRTDTQSFQIPSARARFMLIVPMVQGAIYEGTSNIQLNTIAKFVQKEHS